MTGPPIDIVVDTLRLRGTHARRLARVAARALPAALERALADVDDADVGSVHVHLDVDPDQYDDDTLAVLWADLIRAELLARGVGTVPPDRPVAGVRRPAGPASIDTVVAAARSWLTLAPDAGATVPATLLALADPTTARLVAAALGAEEWRLLVSSLRRSLAGRIAFPDVHDVLGFVDPLAVDAAGALPEAPGPDAVTERTDGGDGPAVTGSHQPDADPSAAADELVAGSSDLLAVLQTLRELHAGAPTPVDPATITRAAGLVLLYPWLADHCRGAEELHPGLDPHDVREAALAAVLADPAAVDDPLVRFLAGRPELRDDAPRDRIALPRQDDVDASAERVVASFAALLPGFERSTPGFVRDAWLVRAGLLDTDRAPAQLTAATHPLDVLLPLLPYPLGLMKLPWCPALTVRFRP